jgi:hypothetical protein
MKQTIKDNLCQNEELGDLCRFPSAVGIVKSKMLHFAVLVARVRRLVICTLVGKPHRKCPLGKLRKIWTDNIRIIWILRNMGGWDNWLSIMSSGRLWY